MLRRRARAILSFCWACCLTSGLQAQPLPASTFGKLPPIADVALSPDGSRAVVLQAQFDTYASMDTEYVWFDAEILTALPFAALEQAGKPHVYIEQANGDHFLSLESHRIEYLEALDAFLSDHLGE